jgi:hypothetical protein
MEGHWTSEPVRFIDGKAVSLSKARGVARTVAPRVTPLLRGARPFVNKGKQFQTLTDGCFGLDFYADQAHFVDHLAPLFIECKKRGIDGVFVCNDDMRQRAIRRGVDSSYIAPRNAAMCNHALVASIGDMRHMANTGRALAILEHGCGLSFGGTQPGHSGGGGDRENFDLFLMTNEWCAERDRKAYPDKRVVTCGSPKMDAWFNKKWKRHDPVVIGYATHWDCQMVPETRSSFPFFKAALGNLAKKHRIIAHCHPRSSEMQWQQFAMLGLDIIRDWTYMLEAVDVLICDVGSAPYEFAATGRPVVVCNSPQYRRNVKHGLRFWDCIPGLECNGGTDLESVVTQAIADPPEAQEKRAAAVKSVYPNQGKATKIAVDALEEWINGR